MSAHVPVEIDPAPLSGREPRAPLGGRSPREGRIDPGLAARTAARRGDAVRAPLDSAVLTSVALLSLIGIVMVYSATAHLTPDQLVPPYLARHVSGVVFGLVLGVLAFRAPLAQIRRLALPFWIGSVLLLVATLVVGTEANGAVRWLEIPGLGRFQPAEFAKLATVLVVATELARRSPRSASDPRRLLLPLLYAAVPAALLLKQPDLGSAVVIVALAGLLVLLAGAPLRLFVLPGIAGAAAVAGYILVKPHAAARIAGFLTPWELSQKEGFQLVQSFVAFGRGGLFGTGLGAGRQKLFYLPEAHTDFILAVVAEELGLLGVLVVLGAFVALLFAGARIARNARDRFALFVAAGTTLLLTLPACMNGMVVTGLVPTKGLALPFLSYGRSNMLVCLVAVALLLGIGSREGAPAPPKVGAAERRGLLRT